MNALNTIIAAAMLTAGLSGGAANRSYEKYHIDDLDVNVNHGLVKVTFTLDPAAYHVSYRNRIEVVPVLKAVGSSDSITLQPVTIAGHNAYYSALREGRMTDNLLRAGHGEVYRYAADVEWQPWMDHSHLTLQGASTGCCGAPGGKEKEIEVAVLDFRPVEFVPRFHYAVPKAEEVKKRQIEGSAYVNFPVNSTEIYPDYMNNPQELRKITGSIDSVRLNPDATVRSIALTGFASPEGPYSNNVRLANGRTEAVKEYVRGQYTFGAGLFRTDAVAEDWEGLREFVATSILPDRNAILDFIDNSTVGIEQRNDELRRRFPVSYDYLLKHIYPSLRHTDYTIDYEIRSYADIDEIRRALAQRPGNLSLNEFFLAANSYPEGSKEYDEVFGKAVMYYPGDTIANLNAANSAMNEGDYRRARMLLGRIKGDATATYAMAVLDALEGDYDSARAGFEAARDAGIPEASDALTQLNAMTARKEGVTYIPEQK